MYIGLIDSRPFHIRFDKVDGFIRVYDRTRYLVLSGSDSIYGRIRYLGSAKSEIAHIFFLNYGTTIVDSYDSLPPEKTMMHYNVIIVTEPVLNKYKNNYYYNTFLREIFYELPKN